MQITRYRQPQTDAERALVNAFEHETTVALALSAATPRNHKAGDDIDERRFRKTQRRALIHARVRVAAMAAYLETQMPAVDA